MSDEQVTSTSAKDNIAPNNNNITLNKDKIALHNPQVTVFYEILSWLRLQKSNCIFTLLKDSINYTTVIST